MRTPCVGIDGPENSFIVKISIGAGKFARKAVSEL
jgi:hypothetical protein